MTGVSVSGDAHAEESWDFFISYATADVRWAEWVAWQLEAAGNRVLIQAWDFLPGMNWQIRMQQGMTHATRTIALLSTAYLNSTYEQSEWRAAYGADPEGFKRQLIPIRIEDCPQPGLLNAVVSIDLFNVNPDDLAGYLLKRIGHASESRAKPAVPPDLPVPLRTTPPMPEPAIPSTQPNRLRRRPGAARTKLAHQAEPHRSTTRRTPPEITFQAPSGSRASSVAVAVGIAFLSVGDLTVCDVLFIHSHAPHASHAILVGLLGGLVCGGGLGLALSPFAGFGEDASIRRIVVADLLVTAFIVLDIALGGILRVAALGFIIGALFLVLFAFLIAMLIAWAISSSLERSRISARSASAQAAVPVAIVAAIDGDSGVLGGGAIGGVLGGVVGIGVSAGIGMSSAGLGVLAGTLAGTAVARR
jgi:hypothetical protein